jgi:Lsr2
VTSRTIVACDVCGKEPAQSTTVLADGRSYEVDLCARHAKALATAIKPYLGTARPSGTRAQRVPVAKKTTAARPSRKRATKKTAKRQAQAGLRNVAEIRAWGQANGFEVATKGRLRPDVIAAFAAAHKKTGKTAKS